MLTPNEIIVFFEIDTGEENSRKPKPHWKVPDET